MNEPDPRWIGRIKETLDQSADALDAGTLSRLNQARQQALGAAGGTLPWGKWFTLPALGWSAALAASLLLMLSVGEFSSRQPDPSLDDLEMLASTDQLEFYDDLEFYQWLAEGGADKPHAG